MADSEHYTLSGDEFEVSYNTITKTIDLKIVAAESVEFSFPLSVSEAEALAETIQQVASHIRRTENRA